MSRSNFTALADDPVSPSERSPLTSLVDPLDPNGRDGYGRSSDHLSARPRRPAPEPAANTGLMAEDPGWFGDSHPAPPVAGDDGPPMSRRTARMLMVVAVLAAGGFAAVAGGYVDLDSLPGSDVEDAFRLENENSGPATAASPITHTLPELEQRVSPAAYSGVDEPRPLEGSPADGGNGFDDAVDQVAGAAVPGEDVGSEEWVEPEIEPQSEWVDGGNGVLLPDLMLRIRFCESTNNYNAAHRDSTARGAYQFLMPSWDWYGHAQVTGVAEAHLATPAQQDEAALRTIEVHGTGPWAESRPCWDDPDIDPRYATAEPPQPSTTIGTTAPPSTDTTTAAAGGTTDSTEVETSTTTAVETTTSTIEAPASTSTTEAPASTSASEPGTTTTAPSGSPDESTTSPAGA